MHSSEESKEKYPQKVQQRVIQYSRATESSKESVQAGGKLSTEEQL